MVWMRIFNMKENSKANFFKTVTNVNRLRLFSNRGMESANKHGKEVFEL